MPPAGPFYVNFFMLPAKRSGCPWATSAALVVQEAMRSGGGDEPGERPRAWNAGCGGARHGDPRVTVYGALGAFQSRAAFLYVILYVILGIAWDVYTHVTS